MDLAIQKPVYAIATKVEMLPSIENNVPMPEQPNRALAATKHGAHGTPEYNAWCNMKARCENTNHPRYADWGGKGIKVCLQWQNSFETFLADVGKKPSPLHSLDRIDGTKGYEPGNVRWATAKEQSENRPSFNRMIEYNGINQSLAKWAQDLGISRGTLRDRLSNNWLLSDALTKPTSAIGYRYQPTGITPEYLAKNGSESGHQKALFCWAVVEANKLHPELRLMFHVPNGNERNMRVAAALKAEGVKCGVPDIFLPVPRESWNGLFIELKRPAANGKPKGSVSEAQTEMIAKLREQGYGVFVAFGWEEARDVILQYLEYEER